jgi:hypothetical protein
VQSNTPFKDLSSAKPAAAPHLQGPFPALVLETETNGDNLGTRAVLNSLSATSFCLEFDHTVSLGDQLLVMTQLSSAILLLRAEVIEIRNVAPKVSFAWLSIRNHQMFSLQTGPSDRWISPDETSAFSA